MPDRNTDESFLLRALELARQGMGLVSPNPCVGAVIVDSQDEIVGSGFHTYDGVKHAEILALEQAGDQAKGATLYINLEPCSHHGRTGPCADAVINAGISRVVAAMQDPNPEVSGRGFARLREAGVSVVSGLLEQEARQLNESFAHYIRHHRPLVTLKAAMTLDGKIASPRAALTHESQHAPGAGGSSREWITGDLARAHVQQLRHQNDAILAGVGTIIADDPLLTDRSGMARRRPLLRVVLDSGLRLPLTSRVVQTAQDDVVVMCSFADENKKRHLQDRRVRVEQISQATPEGHPEMSAIMQRLGEMEISSVLIEGGSRINWAALAPGAADKVFLYYAPKILGGADAVPFAAGAGFAHMADAPHVKNIQIHRFGEDFAVEGYLRDPYAD